MCPPPCCSTIAAGPNVAVISDHGSHLGSVFGHTHALPIFLGAHGCVLHPCCATIAAGPNVAISDHRSHLGPVFRHAHTVPQMIATRGILGPGCVHTTDAEKRGSKQHASKAQMREHAINAVASQLDRKPASPTVRSGIKCSARQI